MFVKLQNACSESWANQTLPRTPENIKKCSGRIRGGHFRKLRTLVSICGFANLISYRKYLRICGEKLKFTTNPQSNKQCCLIRGKTEGKCGKIVVEVRMAVKCGYIFLACPRFISYFFSHGSLILVISYFFIISIFSNTVEIYFQLF